MDKIVKKYVKVDFHIHSIYSNSKDGEQVANNTVENIPILIEKLSENEVEMISITDHNTFNYELYKTIKAYEGKTLLKVLPGIEFDVEIEGKRVHIISIFNDLDDEKIKTIDKKININFDNAANNAYREQTFREILKNIDTNVLLIAHQKSDVRSQNQNENLASIGEEKFDEIIGVDYFDAVEFRSGKVEGMLKDYREEKHLKNLRYITGTDCHDWNYYPNQNKKDTIGISFSYLKILPSFKGLVMALTEPNRVCTVKNKLRKPYIDSLEVEINSIKKEIKLSSGINVLIGDNSIGKSMLFHSLTNYCKCDKKLKNGYEKYMKKNHISVVPIDDTKLQKVRFDRQGEIRELLQSGTKLLDIPFFSERFSDIDSNDSEELIIKYANRVIERINQNNSITNANNALDFDFEIPCDLKNTTYHLRINDDLSYKSKNYDSIINLIKIIIDAIEKLEKINLFEDKEILLEFKNTIYDMYNSYKNKKITEIYNNNICNCIKTVCSNFDDEIKKISEEQDNRIQLYDENVNSCCEKIVNAIIRNSLKKTGVLEDYEEIKLPFSENTYGKYKFVKRFIHKDGIITKEDMESILCEPFKRTNSIDSITSLKTIDEFVNCLKEDYRDDADYKDNYINAIRKYISSKVFKKETKIFDYKDSNEYDNSPGKNALIYLDIISNEKDQNLYMVDQPGDDISHMNINDKIVDVLRNMSKNKQILLITHKAELVVNLDVDNVIIIKRDKNDSIDIYNGALEYEDEKYNILSDVAYMLDGGEETIRKRWKRYDK